MTIAGTAHHIYELEASRLQLSYGVKFWSDVSVSLGLQYIVTVDAHYLRRR